MITFETKVWEGDWKKVLRPESISSNVRRCGHLIQNRVVMVNNVSDLARVENRCQELVDAGMLDSFCHVDRFAEAVLAHFGLKSTDFGSGYRYSIAELTSIYLCKTPYLLHFSGDSMVDDATPQGWLDTGLRVLDRRPDVAVFNLTWNNKHHEVKEQSVEQDDDCYYGYGFSDQMYLIRTADFLKSIYHYSHEGSSAHHHGDIFEKRVDSWMRSTNRLRATLKAGSYTHPTYGD